MRIENVLNSQEQETRPEVIELSNISLNGLLRAAEAKELEKLFFDDQSVLSHPEDAKLNILDAFESLHHARMIKFDVDRNISLVESALLNLQYTLKNIGIARRILSDAHGSSTENMDDEQVVTTYYKVATKIYLSLFQKLLADDPIDSELNELQKLVVEFIDDSSKLQGYSAGSFLVVKHLKDLKERASRKYVKPQIGEGTISFMSSISKSSVDIATLPNGVVVFVENLQLYGYVLRDDETGDVGINFLLEHGWRNKAFSGMPISMPTFELPKVIGNVIPVDFIGGIGTESKVERKRKYDEVFNRTREKGLSKISTHSFDPKYLFETIEHGKFLLPHLGGFQVETSDLAEHTPELRYVSKNFPYYFFIFDSLLLRQDYPVDDSKNVFNGFHFTNGGLDLSHPAFLHCVIPKGIGEKILGWINLWDDEKKRKVFGNKAPDDFFILN